MFLIEFDLNIKSREHKGEAIKYSILTRQLVPEPS